MSVRTGRGAGEQRARWGCDCMKRDVGSFTPRPLQAVQIFPTLLQVGEEFLSEESASDLAGRAVDGADLDDDQLKGEILDIGLSVLESICLDFSQYDALELTEAWFNVLQPADHHWDHVHANHTLSGVIYLTDGCYTIFSDPRPAVSVLSLSYKDATPGNARTFVHHGAPRSIVVFPSWLSHRVATTPKLRKTIAFNLFLRGRYGGERSREQIVL